MRTAIERRQFPFNGWRCERMANRVVERLCGEAYIFLTMTLPAE
ncbi:hypothetical protein HNQ96_004558 [Aminobacter lissarensis]|uniref:Uncharacterized protein n=1 Tax=Aminobacter carboxidus TaxID=376165 RepID=A0A8E1WIS5_9HYPH|nr:hypothetical protein [Aminobacter lissarensis]